MHGKMGEKIQAFVCEEEPETVMEFFKYEKLKEFLQYMKSISKVTSLANWDGSNAIILRHDLDFDIRAAYNLSLIEKECGVESTFFIMTTCHTYNPLSLENRKMLSEMADNGFEIGLHFDPTVYGGISINELKSRVDMEIKILESIVNREVKSISLHNPSVNGQFPLFEGYKNAYSKDIFSDEVYMSDSCMNFRGKSPFEFIKRAKKTTIQILLHPLHYTKMGGSFLDIFASFVLNLSEMIDNNFKVNSTYLSLIRDEMLIDLIIRRVRK
jgi:hypothetical protein